MRKFRNAFKGLTGPRASNASFPLVDILFMALAAVMSGGGNGLGIGAVGQRQRAVAGQDTGPQSMARRAMIHFVGFSRFLTPFAFEGAFRPFMAGLPRLDWFRAAPLRSIAKRWREPTSAVARRRRWIWSMPLRKKHALRCHAQGFWAQQKPPRHSICWKC